MASIASTTPLTMFVANFSAMSVAWFLMSTPARKNGKGRFVGRIWVEDQDYHIVRFNGAYGGSSLTSNYFNFDSWRTNAGKNQWLPAFIYSQEGDVQDAIPSGWPSRRKHACGAMTSATRRKSRS